ncbi:hypothetical protein OC25_04595 [Pedobacter kyungheensis]|uniref:DUF4397 domain-containing protein n=1 Tax=Pedobacter kyungheensis TaxID=1069985 RepID=A0A0C1DP63_9SPHI|nr:DUF4397 domain-containing protein [Pedobacter kyungheensis]KIA95835.1 hypothetical protein OC25_04595 [Pedobacter kyungheensis]
MKITVNYLKHTLAVTLLTISLFACKKDSNTDQPVATTATLSFNNGLDLTGKLDFYINGTKKASLDALLHSDYSEIPEGKLNIKVSNAGSTTAIAASDFTFTAGRNYSAFVCGTVAAPTLVLIEDNLNAAAKDSGKIRFVNLSPGAKGLDLNVRGKQPVFSNLAYKSATSFENMAVATEVNFDLRENGNTQVISSLEKVKIENGKMYTIMATGERSENNANVKMTVITNK